MYLKLIPNRTVFIERLNKSDRINVTVNKYIQNGQIIPIVVEEQIISEAKCIYSDMDKSVLKIITENDNEIFPQFEICFDDYKLTDMRPINYRLLESLIPDLFLRYKQIVNLKLNVRFK